MSVKRGLTVYYRAVIFYLEKVVDVTLSNAAAGRLGSKKQKVDEKIISSNSCGYSVSVMFLMVVLLS